MLTPQIDNKKTRKRQQKDAKKTVFWPSVKRRSFSDLKDRLPRSGPRVPERRSFKSGKDDLPEQEQDSNRTSRGVGGACADSDRRFWSRRRSLELPSETGNGEGDADVILQVHTLNPRQLDLLALLDEIKKHGGEAKTGVGTATKKALVFPDRRNTCGQTCRRGRPLPGPNLSGGVRA